MPAPSGTDPVLSRFRAAVDAAFGQRVERVVLFGSRARGEATANSDYDIAVFLRPPNDLWDDLGPLAGIGTALLLEAGAMISAKPFPAGSWRTRTPLMGEIRRDGRDL